MAERMRTELAPGYSISRVINGCWQLTPDHGGGPGSETEAMRQLSEQLESGFTTFDCADIYTGVESLLGRFRSSLADPHSIQVHTKLVPDKRTLHELTAEGVDSIVNRSLQRLGVERLDLVQLHWWDYSVAGLDLLTERLVRAQQQGKIRLLGATNFDTPHVRQMIEAGVPLVSLQAQYSLLDRRPDRFMAQLSLDTGLGLLAYGALAGGFLGSRYLGQDPPMAVNRSLAKYRMIIEETGGWQACQRLLALLAEIGSRHDVPAELVAARWVLDQPMVSAIILGVGKKSRAAINTRLAGLVLDPQDRRLLKEWTDRYPPPAGDMYDLERVEDGPHARLIKTDLQGATA
ncbi:MAG: aldo/keto reductase [Xanthomonadales bacterium]|jgi:aryl-alcohol dehydrogenase-like predicted oxidoreductase|nr:aldo/keto reductase [Xanthomonadales bacterium]